MVVRLCDLHHTRRISAYFAAALTHVRFLASVDSGVHREGRALNELLVAAWMITHMWSHAGMDAFCMRVNNEEILDTVST